MLRKVKLYGELAKIVGHKELEDPIGKQDLHFVPVITGAGGEGGLGSILTGAALIGASFIPGLQAVTIGTFGFSAPVALSTIAGTTGAFLALGGVSEMLTPTPKTPDFSSEEDPRLSFNFSGTQNTSRAGTPVPIVYGEIFTGSVVISAGVDTEQVRA